MPVEGVIAERVRGILPITWDALSRDSRYGDDLLRNSIKLVQESVFGRQISPEEEETYPLLVLDYAAKLTAIELCIPGIDFWMNEPLSESATGTNENHTFTERAEHLRRLREELIAETRRIAGDIADLIGYRRPSTRRPLSNTIDDEFLTPSPQEFPRPYLATGRS